MEGFRLIIRGKYCTFYCDEVNKVVGIKDVRIYYFKFLPVKLN